jgi:hypothetical protein
MTNIQEERMYELFGKEGISCNEEQELTLLVDQMVLEFDQEIAQINI